MSDLNGWAVALNGVMLAGSCCDNQSVWDSANCQDLVVLDCLTSTPEGLDLPGLRTEDVTYFQRDGAKHFSDWYEPRTITLTGTIGPADLECSDCTTVREQLSELVQAWKRSCCDTELVVYPPCPVAHTEENAYPPTECLEGFGFGEGPFGDTPFGGGASGCTELARNLLSNPSAEVEAGWLDNAGPDFTVTWDDTEFYAGSKSRRSERSDDSTDPNDPNVLYLYSVGSATDTWEPSAPAATAGTTYTASVWFRAGQAGDVGRIQMWFYDNTNTPIGSGFTSAEVPLPAETWTRVSVSGVAPANTAYVYITEAFVFTADSSPSSVGDFANVDAAMITEGALVDYFDGDTPTQFDEATEAWWLYDWTGDPNESESVKLAQAARFHGSIVSGPYGVVGRPRVFQYKWVNRQEQIADFVARFDAVDQRMYILDECGTPGTQSCVHIEPGAQLSSLCLTDGLCLTSGSMCITTPVDGGGSVEPTPVGVGGTEKVYPTITLFGPLISPTVEILTTGEYVQYDGIIGPLPVTINTENGTAFDSEGTSLTHLLRGSLFLSMYPGNYEWRLLANGTQDEDDPGYATACFRPTVVNG